jgi:hypothetical protein
LALLAKGVNKGLGNSDYSTKKPILANSDFGLTRQLAEENSDWTPERIAARQKALARLATSVWRIAQLS